MKPNLHKKLIKVSKLCIYGVIVQLSLYTFAFAVGSNAQNKSVNEIAVELTLHNPASLSELLTEVERTTDFYFSYIDGEVQSNQIKLADDIKSLGDLLRLISEEAGVSFKRVDNTIFIKKAEKKEEAIVEILKQITVSGIVSDENGEALPGATIVEKGTTNGTITDIDGRFTLSVEEGAVLLVSFVGYEPVEVIATSADINVKLLPDYQSLEEVVVVGYGTVKKSDMTGSVVSVKADDINQGVNTSMDQMLKGRAAGVNVVQNSSEPGGGVSISIRGASSFTAGTGPLYVIDGLPINNSALTGGSGASFPSSRTPSNPLSAINPADIQSIEILKDASATAIYGSRGANGVIIVTTKKGRSGEMKVAYDGYVGWQNVIQKLDVLTAEEYKQVMNELIADGGGSAEQTVGDIENGGTDWQDLLYRKNATVSNHNVSMTGGNDKTNYYAAINYYDQQGVVVSSRFQRYGARLNLNSQVSKKLEAGINLNTSYSKNDMVPAQSFGVNEDNGALYAAYNYDPTLAIRNDDGTYQRSPFISIDNPLALAYGKNAEISSYRTLAVAYADYEILPDWTFKLNIGTDVTNQRKDVYVDRTTNDGRANGGIGSIFQETRSNYLVEATSTYKKTVGVHDFTVLGGATTQHFFYNGTSMEARNFPSDATGTNNMGLGDPTLFQMGSDRAGYQLLSYMGRANYSLLDKYLITATLRVDGSSRFGSNNRFGYFPSMAFGWKVKEEAFLSSVDEVSTMKFRASWGQTGNQDIGNYQSLTTFAAGEINVFNVGGTSTKISTTAPTRIANPDLRWETTEQWNVGLDFGLFKDRIYGSFDYFEKKTFDMLINLPIPTSTGFTTQLRNAGSIQNKGIELSLNTVNIEKTDFSWTTSVNLATVKNKVLDLGGIEQIIEGGAGFSGGFFLTEEGQTMRSFYGYQIDGVWQTDDNFAATKDNVAPGDLKFRDINGDSTVNADDRMILGNSFPDLTYSITNTLEYKNFSLMVFFEGIQGVSMLNQNLVDTYFPINLRRNKFAEPYLNRWTEDNPSDTYPSFINPSGQGTKQANSYTIEDASYFRLKTITLSYNLPDFMKQISSASVYVTASNLWTVTGYSGIDPAVNPNGSALTRIDYNAYPTAKSFLVGLKLNF